MATSQGGAPEASSSASSLAEDVSQHPSSPGSVTDLLDPLRTNAEALRLRAKELAELEAAAIEQAENATKAAKAARSTIVRKRLLASEEEHRKLAEEATAQRMKADLLATKAEDELAEAELKAKEAAAAAEAKAAKEAAEAAALAEAAAAKDREDAQKVASAESAAKQSPQHVPTEADERSNSPQAARVKKGGFHSSHVSCTERANKKQIYLVMLSKTAGLALPAAASKPKALPPPIEGARILAPTASSKVKATSVLAAVAETPFRRGSSNGSTKKRKRKRKKKKEKEKKQGKVERGNTTASSSPQQQQRIGRSSYGRVKVRV